MMNYKQKKKYNINDLYIIPISTTTTTTTILHIIILKCM